MNSKLLFILGLFLLASLGLGNPAKPAGLSHPTANDKSHTAQHRNKRLFLPKVLFAAGCLWSSTSNAFLRPQGMSVSPTIVRGGINPGILNAPPTGPRTSLDFWIGSQRSEGAKEFQFDPLDILRRAYNSADSLVANPNKMNRDALSLNKAAQHALKAYDHSHATSPADQPQSKRVDLGNHAFIDKYSYGFVEVDEERKHIFVALRGTKTMQDVQYDSQIGKSTVPQVFLDDTGSDCGIHGGFVKLADELYPKVKNSIKDIRNLHKYEVVLVGHSLGGAVATLIGPRIYNDLDLPFFERGGWSNRLNQIKVISFSSPKVFAEEFKGRYPLGEHNLLRVHHEKDPVTAFPLGFKHLGTEFVFSEFEDQVFERLKQRYFPDWLPCFIKDVDQKWASNTIPLIFHNLEALVRHIETI